MRILLITYDNGSYVHQFPLGTAYIASYLRSHEIDVEIYSQDIHHYSDSHLTNFLDENRFDVIGLGIIGGYYQYRKLLQISQAINSSRQRPFYVIAGHGPSADPDFFLKKTQADAVVTGEGEETMLELVETLEKKGDLSHVRGIAYREQRVVKTNERRPLISNIDEIPMPAYDLFDMNYYRLVRFPNCDLNDFVMPMLSGRGCTFTCNFCYRMDKGLRVRSNDSIIEEVRFLKENYGITYIAFADELLMSSIARTESLCEDIIRADLGVKWRCSGRLNFAKPHVLSLMKKAGCVFVNYGIESMDDGALKRMNKCLTTQQIRDGVRATLDAGMSPGLNIIWGNIGEDLTILDKDVDFLLEHSDGSQLRTIRPVTPYPGSPLFYYAIENGLLKDTEDFYENKHINSDLVSVNFTSLGREEFHEALAKANERLIHHYFSLRLRTEQAKAREFYETEDESFRGFRSV